MADNFIEMEGLTKRYGAITAVDNLTLSVRRGEVFGLLGPNGAGKTTTTLMLLGLTDPTAGSARIAGVDCTRNPLRVKRFVGYLADNMGFYPEMTGRENLRMTGRMNGLHGEALERRIDGLIERVGIAEAVDRRTGTYSKGMKQRLGIADILMKDPDVLIMDEPTNGIDPEGMRELMALIRQLAEEDGKTILISSHQLHQIQQICDRVGIFVAGRLIACGGIGDLARQLEQENGLRYEIGAYLLLTVVYTSMWLGLSMLCSVLCRHAATSALIVIALWIYLTLFASMVVSVIANLAYPLDGIMGFYNAMDNYQLQLTLERASPYYLYCEAASTLLNPNIRTVGITTQASMSGALASYLTFDQSLLLIWPHLTCMVALVLFAFTCSYVLFMRQEIRA